MGGEGGGGGNAERGRTYVHIFSISLYMYIYIHIYRGWVLEIRTPNSVRLEVLPSTLRDGGFRAWGSLHPTPQTWFRV